MTALHTTSTNQPAQGCRVDYQRSGAPRWRTGRRDCYNRDVAKGRLSSRSSNDIGRQLRSVGEENQV
jgi:hypothetical protein